jgi:hypothetical protein
MSLMGAIRYFNSNATRKYALWMVILMCRLRVVDKESQAIFSLQTMQITPDSDMRINSTTLFFSM